MKKLFVSVLVICMFVCMVGCTATASMTLTYNVDNGDSINVKLNTIDGYSMTAESPFDIMKGEEVVTTGTFINSEDFEAYYEAVAIDESAEILEEGEKNGYEYLLWHYDAGEWQEYNYAIRVTGTNTGILLGNTVSKESAQEVFDRLTFSVK